MVSLKSKFILKILIVVTSFIGCQKQESEVEDIIVPQLEGNVLFVNNQQLKIAEVNLLSVAKTYGNVNYDCSPKWSNDGTKFAYIFLEGGIDSTCFFLRIIDVNSGAINDWKIGNSKYINVYYQISWSPDDKTVIFLGKGGSHQNTIVYLNTLNGDTVQSHFNLNFNEYCTAIACNPKEYKVAVNIDIIESFHHENRIWWVNPFETVPVKQFKIEAGWGPVEYMDWNFDGTKLIYSLSSYGDLFVTDADGNNNNMIPEINGLAPCWSKKDGLIMYQGLAGFAGSTIIPGIFVSDVNGSFERLLLKNGSRPDWY